MALSRQAIIQHLDMLRKAGLINDGIPATSFQVDHMVQMKVN